VLVIDMDWHRPGWTGYTWDRDYFPDHRQTLARLKARGLKLTCNLHPADGVARHEEGFAAVCRDLGLDPRRTRQVPFDCTDPRFIDAYFRHLHHPHEDAGVDFWWLDWQQGTSTGMEGLDPLPWLNHLHYQDPARRHPDRRPLLLSRFGGIGSHRHPLGFSGDTYTTWTTLAHQPRFTATAANILYGFWSHDIGGHMPGPIEPELYLRWLQFGIHSPVLRSHCSKNPRAERRIAQYPEPWRSCLRRTVERRYELVPYLASECRAGHESGGSLCRPMYHRWPGHDQAWHCDGQYLFGSEMIVAPVVQPVSERDGQAEQRVWLPGSGWIDTALGERCRSGWRSARYLPDETPVFVRAGAVLPAQPPALRLPAGSFPHLVVEVWSGGDGAYGFREDDGDSLGYQRGEEALIPLRHEEGRGGRRTIAIGPAEGGYAGFLRRRRVSVRIHLAEPAQEVAVGGRTIPFAPEAAARGWRYEGDTATLVVDCGELDLVRGAEIAIRHRQDLTPARLDGLPGLMRRLDRAAQLTRAVSRWVVVDPDERYATHLAQAGNRIARDPGRMAAELAEVRRGLRRLPALLGRYAAAYRRHPRLQDDARESERSLLLARRLVEGAPPQPAAKPKKRRGLR
jgi:alpha-glucosidase